MTKKSPPVSVGIDVGKAQLDVYLLERDRIVAVPNDDEGVRSLVKRLARYRLERSPSSARRSRGASRSSSSRPSRSAASPAPSASSPKPTRSMPA